MPSDREPTRPPAGTWVVYLMTMPKGADGMRAVCSQAEWNVMEASRPGFHALIQAGFRSEREAELVARGTSGDPVKRGPKRP